MSKAYFKLSIGSFAQDWTDTAIISSNNDWTGVPSIEAYRGDDLTSATGTDPRTLLAPDSGLVLNVIANQVNPNSVATGGVGEFQITNPTIALQGSGTADAPYIIIYLDATGRQDITLQFNARDIDGSADNAVQQLATQYRVGETGNWTNLPAGYLADASTGPSLATLVTPVTVILPAAANDAAQLQLRILTTNAPGSDEWIGIDDIEVASSPVVGADAPRLNEFVFNHVGTDTNEFVEVSGTAATDYSGYALVLLEGDVTSNAGTVIFTAPLGTSAASGLWSTGFLPTNTLQNGSQTLLLVGGFSGILGSDLDTNNDGALDATPWTSVVDRVAVTDGGAGDLIYLTGTTLAPGSDGDNNTWGGASRFAGDLWLRNDFAGNGLPGFATDPTPDTTEAVNTEAAANLREVAAVAGFTVNPTSVAATEGGATGSFTVRLATAPSASVTLPVSVDSQVTASAAALTFTPDNWNIAQAVTVTAVDDAAAEGTHAGLVTLGAATSADAGYNGLDPADIPVTITDNDVLSTTIGTVQGSGKASALAGQVVTIRGNITARDSNGFWVQDGGDGNAATSDGIFVFTSSAPAASLAIGDGVQVTGTVAEFLPGSAAVNLTLTELIAPSIAEVAPLATITPTLIGTGGRVPPNGSAGSAFTDLAGYEAGIAFYESLEGMLVTIVGARAISGTNGFGETWVVTDNGANATGLNARGGLTVTAADNNPERIQIQYDSGVLPGFAPSITTGDRLGNVTGVVGYDFGEYQVTATAAFSVTPGNLQPETTSLARASGKLLVAEYNVENLDPGDGAAKFATLAQHIVANLNRPDIVALQEIQDNNGATNDGTTSADVTLQTLVDAIVAAGGPHYSFAYIAPTNGTSGGEPGGNIRNGFLYDAARVSLTSLGQVVDTAATAGDAFAASRIPLVGNFAFNGETVTLINIHSSSKGGSSTDFGAFFPPVDGAQAARIAQATEINAYVDALLAANPAARILVLGDHNAFSWETPELVMRGALAPDGTTPGTAVLADLNQQDAERERYTYNFDGNSQSLDHTLASAAAQLVATYDTVHVNSEFADAARVSDHDPSVTLLDFTRPLISAGDVDQDSAVLLAKVNLAGTVTFQVSLSADFATPVATRTAVVADPLLPAKVVLADGTLAAGTRYYWRAVDAAGVAEIGQFRTADAATVQNGFSMGVTGDWRGETAPYPAIANADTAGLDLFIKLGDTIYADYPSPALPQPQALTLQDYLVKQLEVYSERAGLNAWNDLQKTTPILATIDDHEVINDFAGGAPASSDPRFGTTTGLINDTVLYENGLSAFLAYNAIEDRVYPNTGSAPRTDGEHALYRYVIEGKDAAVYVLDARSFRDAELAPVANPTDPTQIGNFLVQSFNPGRTMLGTPQLSRLEADLLDAQAKGVVWKFVQLPEPIQNLGVIGAEDRYEGYAAERTHLLKFINDQHLTNVVFVSADIHGTVVNNLTYQTAPGTRQIATSAWEITTGSVAFDAPFGQTVDALGVAAGLISPAQQAFYNSLPVAPDTDSIPNDKDDFIKSVVNAQVTALGYDPVGLDSNLAQANGLIDATLLSGDYLVTHSYTWTRFDVDATTSQLTVTTYGVPYYSAADAAANPAAIAALQPAVLAKFTVAANLGRYLAGTPGADKLTGGIGDDTMFGGAGNDTLVGDAGDDRLAAGTGNNRATGGAGADIFVFDTAPTAFNLVTGSLTTITDFETGHDRIEILRSAFDPSGTNLVPGRLTDQPGHFVANLSGQANLAAGEFVFETDVRTLWWDADGTGPGVRKIVASLGTGSIDAADIWIA